MLDAAILDRLFEGLLAADGSSAAVNFAKWFLNSRAVDAAGSPLALFHGTRGGDFTEFKPRFRVHENLGFGLHFALDRSFAERYAHDPSVARKKGGTPHVFEVVASVQNPLKADCIVAEGSREFGIAQKLAGSKLYVSSDENRCPCVYMQNAIDSTSPQRALRLLRDEGYDGVFYQTRLTLMAPGSNSGTVTAKSEALIVFDPWQIKSLRSNSGLFRLGDPSMDDGASLIDNADRAKATLATLSRMPAP